VGTNPIELWAIEPLCIKELRSFGCFKSIIHLSLFASNVVLY